MQLSRRIATSLITVAMLATIVPTNVFADNINATHGDTSVPINLNVTAAEFKVTLPTTFPVDVDASGAVTTAENTKIVNNSQGPIRISQIKVTPKNSWELAAFNSDFSAMAVNTKKIALKLFDKDATDEITYTSTINKNAEVSIPYDARLATQSVALDEQPLNVVFTLDWKSGGHQLNKTSLSLAKGSSETLSIENPSGEVIWASDDESIATVVNGKVTAVSWGTTNITATIGNEVLTCSVEVTKTVSGISFDSDKLNVRKGASTRLNVTTAYRAASFEWSSSNPSVATIEDGILTAVEYGTTIITVRLGEFSDTCTVTVDKGKFLTSENLAELTNYNNGTSIQLPEDLIGIEKGAFAGTKITDIIIPDSLETIEDGAFIGATELRAIDVSLGNNYYSSNSGVLFSLDETTLIAYPAGNTNNYLDISSYSSKVTKIAPYAFYNAKPEEVIIPEGVTSIGAHAFEGANKLRELTLPTSLVEIGDRAFYNKYVSPPAEESMHNSSFSVVNLDLCGSQLKTIGTEAFYGNRLLTISIPDEVTSIGNNAFYMTRLFYGGTATGSPWGASETFYEPYACLF